MTEVYEENWTEEETGVVFRRFFFPYGHRATVSGRVLSVKFTEEFHSWWAERGLPKAYLVEAYPKFAMLDIPIDNPVAMEIKFFWGE